MVWRDWSSLVFTNIINLVHLLWTQSPTLSTCGHLGISVTTRLSRTLSRMSSKMSSGYPPGPTLMATMRHEQRAVPWGGWPQKQEWGWEAQNWDEDYYLEILGGERGRHHYKLLFFNCLVFEILGFFIPRLSLGMNLKLDLVVFISFPSFRVVGGRRRQISSSGTPKPPKRENVIKHPYSYL